MARLAQPDAAGGRLCGRNRPLDPGKYAPDQHPRLPLPRRNRLEPRDVPRPGAGLASTRGGSHGAAVKPTTGRGLSAIVTRIVVRPLRALARKTAEVHAILGRAVEAFVGEWSRLAAPIIAARSRRLLHLGSAAVALGLIAGLYFRGIVFRYEAGWESTFLGPSQVRDVLGVLFGPAARWSGIALPASTEAVAALRWDATGGGGDAAPWIHLIAVTLAIYVVIPRLAIAGAAWLNEAPTDQRVGDPARPSQATCGGSSAPQDADCAVQSWR